MNVNRGTTLVYFVILSKNGMSNLSFIYVEMLKITSGNCEAHCSAATRVRFYGPGSVYGPFRPNGSILGMFFLNKKKVLFSKFWGSNQCFGPS